MKVLGIIGIVLSLIAIFLSVVVIDYGNQFREIGGIGYFTLIINFFFLALSIVAIAKGK